MIKAIVIDDESMARDTIELFVKNYAPEIQLCGKAKSVDEGIELIKTHSAEIVFLDINMPERNGFTLFQQISTEKLHVIFTTAYSEYAIQALNLSATYYLLKPISPEEFRKAITKTLDNIKHQLSEQVNYKFLLEILAQKQPTQSAILVNTKNGYERIETSSINYLEGDKNYSWIYTSESKFLATKTLKEFEDILDPSVFFRSHQSHIVNKNCVKKVLNTKPDQIELINGIVLNLSRDKKKSFLEWLAK